MTTTLKKIALAKQPNVSEGRLVTDNYLGVIGDIEVSCLVRLGTLTMTISELRHLRQGQILSLQQKTYEPIDILLNNQVIARGELMSCDEHFAIQITEVHS
jgi:flagellar motor switch protein FliN/FliY